MGLFSELAEDFDVGVGVVHDYLFGGTWAAESEAAWEAERQGATDAAAADAILADWQILETEHDLATVAVETAPHTAAHMADEAAAALGGAASKVGQGIADTLKTALYILAGILGLYLIVRSKRP